MRGNSGKKRSPCTGSSLTMIALATPAAAAAQTTWTARIDAVRNDAKLHAGPFYAKPQLLLKEVGTDSNVFNEAGDQKSDFTMTVAPMFEIWVPVARRALLEDDDWRRFRLLRAGPGRTIDRSAADAPRRGLPQPRHAVRRDGLPQHPAAS